MAERNLLVVLLEDRFRPRLRQAIAERNDETARVHVVAPARVGPLEWFATDEDEARAAAAARVLEVERLLADEVEVESEVGDAGPVLAVEHALRSFPADQILLVGGAAEDGGLETSLRSFSLPVTRIPVPEHVREENRLREAVRGLASGRSKATPFVVFTGVNSRPAPAGRSYRTRGAARHLAVLTLNESFVRMRS